MHNILFFNADEELISFADKHPIDGAHFVFFEESVNAVSLKKIDAYYDTEILSLFVHSEKVDTARLDLFPNLKLIATRSTGFNHIDLDYCKQRGIKVVNVPRYGESTVAEFAFGLILALSRKIILAKTDMSHNRVVIPDYIGFDLQGKTLGVIGTGSIGRHMIQIARGFGMRIKAFDPFHNPELAEFYVPTLEDLYRESDIISLHIPSTPDNFHLLDKQAFSKMKKGVMIINTARGELIDTQALYEALRQGRVGSAGLDVLENEDFIIHDEISANDKIGDNDFLLDSAMNLKLLQFKNVIATPHIAFNSQDAIDRILLTSFDNIRSFLAGDVKNNVVR